MPRLRVLNFSISLDGFGAGPGQSLDDPLGAGGHAVHDWVFATRGGKEMIGISTAEDPGEEGLDNDLFLAGFDNIGATVMGRNMFGPERGEWDPASEWKGWWGPDPVYHHDVFVLTHHARDPIPMEGGTTFHFVTEGLDVAVERAFAAADGKDVRLGGGVSTVQQALTAGLVDDMLVDVSPVFLGSGESLFAGMEDAMRRYECSEVLSSPRVAHYRFVKR